MPYSKEHKTVCTKLSDSVSTVSTSVQKESQSPTDIFESKITDKNKTDKLTIYPYTILLNTNRWQKL